jgi:hypothetical protein
MIRHFLIASLFSFGIVAETGIAEAKRPPCSSAEIAIPDVRPGGGKLCLKKSEMQKAKKICSKLRDEKGRPVHWMGCICQDGDSVGACGD